MGAPFGRGLHDRDPDIYAFCFRHPLFPLSAQMLQVQWRASGNELLALDEQEHGALFPPGSNTVKDLKHYLHRLSGISPFRQSLTDSANPAVELDGSQQLDCPLSLLLIQKSFCSGDNKRYADLKKAVEENQIQDVEALLSEPQDPDLLDNTGRSWSFLHAACFSECEDSVRLLLEANCNRDIASIYSRIPGDRLWTPLMVAVDKGYASIVRLLIRSAADVGKATSRCITPMLWAVCCRRIECVVLLVESRADVNAKDCDARTPLHAASEQGHATAARVLLEAGAVVNAARLDKAKPIQLASRRGHDHLLSLLMRFRAELDEVVRDGASWRLFLASSSDGDQTAVVARLLEARANVDFPRRCPLHLAAALGHAGTAELLLAAAADPDRVDWSGARPLRLAAENGHSQVLRHLLAAKADTERAELFQVPYTDEVLQLLAGAGAVPGPHNTSCPP